MHNYIEMANALRALAYIFDIELDIKFIGDRINFDLFGQKVVIGETMTVIDINGSERSINMDEDYGNVLNFVAVRLMLQKKVPHAGYNCMVKQLNADKRHHLKKEALVHRRDEQELINELICLGKSPKQIELSIGINYRLIKDILKITRRNMIAAARVSARKFLADQKGE